jgi:hypothetical protein
MRVIKPINYLKDTWESLYDTTWSGYLDDGTPGTVYTPYDFLYGTLYEQWTSSKAFPIGSIVWWEYESQFYLYRSKTNEIQSLSDTDYWEFLGAAYWKNTETYIKGVVIVYEKRLYESLVENNIGNMPGLTSTTSKWLDLGTDNRVALFDVNSSRPSISRVNFSAQINPNILRQNNTTINSIGISLLKNISSVKVSIWQNNSSGLSKRVWTNTYSVAGKSTALLDGIPYSPTFGAYAGVSGAGKILLEFTISGSDVAEVGTVVFGTVNTLGNVQYGAKLGIEDYSIKEPDDYGNVTFVKRQYNRNVSISFDIVNSSVAAVQQLLYDLRATPTYWEVTDINDFNSVTNFVGWYTDFNCTISRPTVSTYTLDLRSLR